MSIKSRVSGELESLLEGGHRCGWLDRLLLGVVEVVVVVAARRMWRIGWIRNHRRGLVASVDSGESGGICDLSAKGPGSRVEIVQVQGRTRYTMYKMYGQSSRCTCVVR